MLVQKYGGSSLKNTARIVAVADRVAVAAKSGPLVVVVSAMGDTTDHLIDLARSVADRPDKREIDMLLATGEQVSASLLDDVAAHPALSVLSGPAQPAFELICPRGAPCPYSFRTQVCMPLVERPLRGGTHQPDLPGLC